MSVEVEKIRRERRSTVATTITTTLSYHNYGSRISKSILWSGQIGIEIEIGI